MKNEYLPIIIRADMRVKYYEILDKAMVSHNYTDFIKLVEEEIRILDQCLELVE